MSVLVSLCLLKIELVVADGSNSHHQSPQSTMLGPTESDASACGDDAAAAAGGSIAGDGKDQAVGAVSTEHPNNPRLQREMRGQRKPKKITIESYRNRLLDGPASATDDYRGILPKSSREPTPMDGVLPSGKQEFSGEINFFSGNPFVEVTKGILHLFKRNERANITEGGVSKTICLIAVPSSLNCHDILNFIAPCHQEIQHVRILRDGSPNQFMVLLEFRCDEGATEFYKTFNGVPYNSLEPDSLCHAVWVSSVEWGLDGCCAAPQGHTELPMCPVCLERMDESVDGVLTILCNHAFHAGCLIKWGDSTCPVCRCIQTPELSEPSVCMECEGTEALWICLICGHIGCGRYQGGHAASHYRATNHTYALQLGTNRVWDYAGDNFVHRLLQSKSDGKLVATQSPGGADGEEKIDSMQLEFTYLLTSQLDAQRDYYEERLSRLEGALGGERQKLQQDNEQAKKKYATLETKLQALTKEKNGLEKKITQLTSKMNTVTKELAEEKQFGKTLQSNQTSWQTKFSELEKKCTEKEQEIVDLKEQVRDLMFYMEAQNTIAGSELKHELVDGTVILPGDDSATLLAAAAGSSGATGGSGANKASARRRQRKK
ncbi:BRCA1-associated protein isoform X2 [Anopheles cruzii]|uniref:BRCA1-associated protein isoform X2 n=1 Tax=Anopheles cruzii TaxID=68878 RepID=UPI0022EC8388|nr:BRCA1-associated protein isoform X2 [Anopheles cruzii]